MPRAVTVRRILAVACLLLPAACFRNPEADMRTAQNFIEMGDAMNDLRENASVLANTVDSLRAVVAKQDTTIARLANATGVVVAR